MFSRATKGTSDKLVPDMAAPPEASRKAPRAPSLISDNITIEGSVIGEGELQIDGVVRGEVRVDKVTIGETGHVEGAIFAEVVETRGRVIGQISAKQVRLHGTAYVDGDITHEQLAMESGAFFQGRSLKFQRPAAPPAISAPTLVSETEVREPSAQVG
ncbi:polymer-forming cytoskeletal protein [Phenylobacterium sp. LH3H17]|uniref:bactofilin family protein n=1 Tax=Phenylobacterium sp. LH3H17 TaxID=2903901 RepID=UPI0020CA1A63|nr:polymer-forming cytoskeletal protein [Phenylobacterium sp. LH3H17]UTP41509.1 polymer-forming cytoskeletal protein [Phenylobacterium sp. LH3H17]